ncbi:hypothetical protein RHGRI_007251 [Rhododendron griersonianum]|uniref:Uncharacterized protein n=1 Tax=Rhododendron griersonianum TaxID=479676 RepID=A0AAV6KY18_9ERIC|nr:hypothetical protein RHGRI_007251 [Rhododendron griersonianum]
MSLREVATNPSQVSSSYEPNKGGFYSRSLCPLLHNSQMEFSFHDTFDSVGSLFFFNNGGKALLIPQILRSTLKTWTSA